MNFKEHIFVILANLADFNIFSCTASCIENDIGFKTESKSTSALKNNPTHKLAYFILHRFLNRLSCKLKLSNILKLSNFPPPPRKAHLHRVAVVAGCRFQLFSSPIAVVLLASNESGSTYRERKGKRKEVKNNPS